MSLRICILETDVLRPELTAQYQGYGRMFEQLFSRQPVAAEFQVYNVMNGDYPLTAKSSMPIWSRAARLTRLARIRGSRR